MRKALLTMATAAVMAVPTGALQAQEAEASGPAEASWIHVRVDEAEGARVRVNLPMSLAEMALEIAGEEALEGEHLQWDSDGDVSLDDIRRMWRELRDAGDADFVEVQEDDEHVRVFRRGDRVHVQVDEEGVEKVRVEVPAGIVDALLGTEGDELDLAAAMQEMARTGEQNLVQVQDGETTVRVWIDQRNTQGS